MATNTNTTWPTYTELLSELRRDPQTAEALLEAVAFAGSLPDWDSETIENVLYPLIALLERHGAPHVGSTAYWRHVATDMGAEFGHLEEDEEEREDPINL